MILQHCTLWFIRCCVHVFKTILIKTLYFCLQADSTSNDIEKRSNDKSKRGHHNTIFVETPQSFNVQNDPIEIDQPSFYGAQLDSEDEDNNNLGGIDIVGPPSLAYPSMNYRIRQEEDGGILIEPDHLSSITSGKAHNFHATDL